MGFKCNIVAWSPGVPREDILAHPPASPEATAARLEALWPGRFELSDGVDDLAGDCYPMDEFLRAGLWGDTLVIVDQDTEGYAVDPATEALGTPWQLEVHSVVDLCAYWTPMGDVEVSGDSEPEELRDAFAGRTLMPFEEPFARGEHRYDDPDYQALFHPADLANSAALWMFGFIGETPPSDDVTSAITPAEWGSLPMYRFLEYASYHETDAPKKGFFARVFGR